MTTSAQVRNKGVQTQRLLKVSAGAKGKSEVTFTSLIIPSGLGYARVGKLAEGVSVFKAEQIRARAKLEECLFSSIIGYSEAHYKRLIRNKSELLKEGASNRLYRFAEVIDHAVDLYDGDQDTALRWLSHPNPAFGNQPPMQMLKSEVGADMVDKFISQLELGILPI